MLLLILSRSSLFLVPAPGLCLSPFSFQSQLFLLQGNCQCQTVVIGGVWEGRGNHRSPILPHTPIRIHLLESTIREYRASLIDIDQGLEDKSIESYESHICEEHEQSTAILSDSGEMIVSKHYRHSSFSHIILQLFNTFEC
ncbi:hypothetical protein PMAYCL1PPCAC_18268 [Pristionchus mayeri]|uniref:Uncharacterized protein n=1 Tax=Pristionchus mayeri TaxID=1317129 RepID=A0AAN5I193_9BILA|nr:hypothetical protein PMAYCL1PPCAC_18268 [Pristionchus mayeri]